MTLNINHLTAKFQSIIITDIQISLLYGVSVTDKAFIHSLTHSLTYSLTD